jgi:hypothetical protein
MTDLNLHMLKDQHALGAVLPSTCYMMQLFVTWAEYTCQVSPSLWLLLFGMPRPLSSRNGSDDFTFTQRAYRKSFTNLCLMVS